MWSLVGIGVSYNSELVAFIAPKLHVHVSYKAPLVIISSDRSYAADNAT